MSSTALKNTLDNTLELHHAIRQEDLATVQRLVETYGVNIVNDRDLMGHTALHCACYHNRNVGIVSYLVQTCHANMEATTNVNGWTPLIVACHCQNTKVAQYLMRTCGANVLVHVLEQNRLVQERLPILHYTVRFLNDKVVQWLVRDVKIDTNVVDEHGQTALHYACRHCSSAANVRCLVETCRTADADATDLCFKKDHNGQTALHIAVAASQASLEKTRILYLYGGYGATTWNVATTSVDTDGCTVFHRATTVKVLLFLLNCKKL